MGKFGKYVNVSCWTDDTEESIPLWNLYTPNMKGVRIGLPKFPFRKYRFEAGKYHLKSDIDAYINLDRVYDDNRASIVAKLPLLCKVEYTDDNCFKELEILIGPRVSHGERIIIEALVGQFCQSAKIMDSSLRIR